MQEPLPLSSQELQALREKAARGAPLSDEEVALFVRSTRKSWLALPAAKAKGKGKKTAPVSEEQIDFF